LSEEIDGSQLEGNSSEPVNIEPEASVKVPSFISGERAQETAPTTEESAEAVAIPEKFQGKSVEDVIKSYTELEALQGRSSSKLGQETQKRIQLEQRVTNLSQILENLQNQQSSQTADKGNQLEGDLNEMFYERGADVVQDIVSRSINQAFTQREQATKKQSEQFEHQRNQEITSVAQAELEMIANEYGDIDPLVLNQIVHIDNTDPDLQNLRNDPSLTPDRVRQETRKIYDRAKEEVLAVANKLGGVPNSAQLEAFQKAQKASANGSPSDTASSPKTLDVPDDPKTAMMRKAGWGFIVDH